MRLLVDNRLRRALVHVGMRFELEEKVEHVDQEKYNASSAADFQNLLVGELRIGSLERLIEGSLREY